MCISKATVANAKHSRATFHLTHMVVLFGLGLYVFIFHTFIIHKPFSGMYDDVGFINVNRERELERLLEMERVKLHRLRDTGVDFNFTMKLRKEKKNLTAES